MYPIRTGIAAAILAAAMMSTAAAADTAPPQPMGAMHEGHEGHFGPQRMYEKLGLSAAQKAKSDAVFAAKGPMLKKLHEQMHANMEKLHQISPDDPGYGATVSKLAQANGSLMTQMITAHGDMRAQLFAILTPAQRTQLAGMEAKMREHMREHMHGRGHMKAGEGHWGHDGPPPPPPPPESEPK
jgi:periplasmic protein CpxP/Spy